MNHSHSLIIVRAGALALIASLAAGCTGGDSTEDRGACPGLSVALPDQGACVFESMIVIETGFSCPASFPSFQNVEGFGVCSERGGPFTPEELGTLREAAGRAGYIEVSIVEPNDGGRLDGDVIDRPDAGFVPDIPRAAGSGPLDVLFVIDNSFSMCEEQEGLRENFRPFVARLAAAGTDFHLAVTTTHAPLVQYELEPLAKASQIQALPQPVPATSPTCLSTSDAQRAAGATSDFEPVRQALALAKTCLADPSLASNYEWTDAQIACAYSGPNDRLRVEQDCAALTGIPDTNADGNADEFDLFPAPDLYRGLRGGGKVLKASAYQANGTLDVDAIVADFACMATAGTLGTGYEKGLQAAVDAVSPNLTGYSIGSTQADAAAPNHGFLRSDARFALFFVTDENDCSHNGEIQEQGDRCGGDSCYYWNSTQIPEADSPLIPVATLADRFRANLAASKEIAATTAARDALEGATTVVSMHGGYERYSGPYPALCDGTEARPEKSCASPGGPIDSGDRYERFMRQFAYFYPTIQQRTGMPNAGMPDPDFGVVGSTFDFANNADQLEGGMCTGFEVAFGGGFTSVLDQVAEQFVR